MLGSSSSRYPLSGFASLAVYPESFGSCFAELIPIHLNPEFFPNEIPLVLPPIAPAVRRGRPPKPQPEPRAAPKVKETPKERELLKKRAEYRQYWLASVKFPIDESILHSPLGYRRLGPPTGTAKTLANAETLLWPASAALRSCSIDPEALLLSYLFLQTFAPYLALPRYSVSDFYTKLSNPVPDSIVTSTFIAVYRFLEPELILASDSLIQILDKEEQLFLQTAGRSALTTRPSLQAALNKLKSDLLFYRNLFELAPVTPASIWALVVHAAAFITAFATLDFKEDLFSDVATATATATATGTAPDGAVGTSSAAVNPSLTIETSWVIDEGLDFLDFHETPVSARIRILKTLVEKLLDSAVVKKILDINAELRVRAQAELGLINKHIQRVAARMLSAKRLLDAPPASSAAAPAAKIARIARTPGSGTPAAGTPVGGTPARGSPAGDIPAPASPAGVASFAPADAGAAGADAPAGASLRDQLAQDSATKSRAAAVKAALIRVLAHQPHSSQPLGSDRELNEYFLYPYAPNTVLVWLKKRHTVGVVGGEKALEKLIDSLDVRGVREDALRRSLLDVKTEELGDHAATAAAPGAVGAAAAVAAEAELARLLQVQVPEGAAEAAAAGEASSFAFLRQTVGAAGEAVRRTLDAWMGDTEGAATAAPGSVAGADAVAGAREVAAQLRRLLPRGCAAEEAEHEATWAQLLAAEGVPGAAARLPLEPGRFGALVEAVGASVALMGSGEFELTERQVVEKVGRGREGVVTGEEVECGLCGKRCVNAVLLDVHARKWCKQREGDAGAAGSLGALGAGDAGEGEGAGGGGLANWTEAVEAVTLSGFPALGQAKHMGAGAGVAGGAGAGAFVCEACGKEFTQQASLSLHVRKWCKGAAPAGTPGPTGAGAEEAGAGAGGGPPFRCGLCHKEMATANGLTVHLGRWCPEKAAADEGGAGADLTTGWGEDEEHATAGAVAGAVVGEGEIPGTPAESAEENILLGEAQTAKVSQSAAALALTWLLRRAQEAKASAAQPLD